MEPRWDRAAKLYALDMYFLEAMTVVAFPILASSATPKPLLTAPLFFEFLNVLGFCAGSGSNPGLNGRSRGSFLREQT